MTNYFIRGKEAEGCVEAETLPEAFVVFVKDNPVETLGLLLIGNTEYFLPDEVPESAIATRTTIPLVKASIWTEEEAMDFNEGICGKRII